MPLFFAGPGVTEGQAVSTPVSASSLLPTLADMVGLDPPADAEYPSLAPTLRGRGEPAPAPVFSELDYGVWGFRDGDRAVMIRHGRWKLALFRDPRHPDRFDLTDGLMLYDLDTDPGERRNLAADPAGADVVADLVARIDAWDHSREIRTPVIRPEGPRKPANR